MSKNSDITDLDFKHYSAKMFDAEHDAQRVILVGGSDLKLQTEINSPQSKEIQIERIEIPVIIKELEIREIQVPCIVKETVFERIEVPLIVEKIRLVEIDKPIIVNEYKTIEIPIVIKEKEIEPFPKWGKFLLITQFVCYIVFNIIK